MINMMYNHKKTYHMITQTKEFKTKFWRDIKNSSKVAIVTHRSPDEDAIASVLSILNLFIENDLEPQFDIVIEGSTSEQLKFLNGFDQIYWSENIKDFLNDNNYEVIVFVDSANEDQFSRYLKYEDLNSYKVFCIDHHTPEQLFNYENHYQDSLHYSTTAVIYDLFYQDVDHISNEQAKCLLAGIVGDSNFFKFIGKDNEKTMNTAIEILGKSGSSLRNIADLMSTITSKQFEVLKEFMNNTRFIEFRNSNIPPLTYSFLDYNYTDIYDPSTIKAAQIHYVLNYLRYIEGYKWGFLIMPAGRNCFKLSFRSTTGGVLVNELMADNFGGGGHPHSAGGLLRLETDEIEIAIKNLLNIIENSNLKFEKLTN